MSGAKPIVVTSIVGLLLSAGASTLAAKEITATEFSNFPLVLVCCLD